METKLINYVKSSCNLEEIAAIIHWWRKNYCEQSDCDIYNLTIEDDFNEYKKLYGKETAERCLKISPYWFGGRVYYANVLDKNMYRPFEISPLNENNYKNILITAVNRIEECFNMLLDVKPIVSYDSVIETFTKKYENLIDFKKYTLDTREDYKKNCIVPRYIWAMGDNDVDFGFSDKIFVTIADCYDDMCEIAKKVLVNNIRCRDKDIYSMVCKKNDEILLHIGTDVRVYKIFEIKDNAFIPCLKKMQRYIAKCINLAKDFPL